MVDGVGWIDGELAPKFRDRGVLISGIEKVAPGVVNIRGSGIALEEVLKCLRRSLLIAGEKKEGRVAGEGDHGALGGVGVFRELRHAQRREADSHEQFVAGKMLVREIAVSGERFFESPQSGK